MDKIKLKNSFIYAFTRSIPILIGFLPVGLAYGILMAEAGYGVIFTMCNSLFIYAGSLQLLIITFFKSAIPLATVTVTALLLNSRHIFYGMSFTEKFRGYGLWKYYLIFGLADEDYSLLCSYKPRDDVDEKTVHIITTALLHIYWIVFSGIGCFAGGFITAELKGLDFALTALFVVILTDKLRECKSKIPFVCAAASSALSLALFGRDNFLLPALAATVAELVLLRKQIDKEAAK